MATQENWDERNQDQPIEFEGGNEVCEGCLIDLEQNGVRITASTHSSPREARREIVPVLTHRSARRPIAESRRTPARWARIEVGRQA